MNQQIGSYKLVQKKGDGTFSVVYKARSLKTNELVAIKVLKTEYPDIEQVKKLKEIIALKLLRGCSYIIELKEILHNSKGKLALVFELMEQNLYQAIKRDKINSNNIKKIFYQILKSVAMLHNKGFCHRDVKPQNILLIRQRVKLADFGSCKNIYSHHPYTEYISTRWYRAPQCLMTDGFYDYKMDIWGVGCVFFQTMTGYPLFPGSSQMDQINKIHQILGTPPPQIIKRFKTFASHMQFNFDVVKGCGLEKLFTKKNKLFIDLLYKLLAYDPFDRITADDALNHEYFKGKIQMKRLRNIKWSLPCLYKKLQM